MAMKVQEIQKWLNSLPENAEVGVDEGGLTLKVTSDPTPYLEVGGLPRLTQEKIDEYVKEGGGFCPYCGSQDIEGGSLDFDGGVYQKMGCNECDETWVDAYRLANVLD